MLYCPNHNMRILETGNARFIKNGEISESTVSQDVKIKEVRVQVPLARSFSSCKLKKLLLLTTTKKSNTIMIP